MFIVELRDGCWLASSEGDPGRTSVKESAKAYPSFKGAVDALWMARKYQAFENARICKLSGPMKCKDFLREIFDLLEDGQCEISCDYSYACELSAIVDKVCKIIERELKEKDEEA